MSFECKDHWINGSFEKHLSENIKTEKYVVSEIMFLLSGGSTDVIVNISGSIFYSVLRETNWGLWINSDILD